MGSLQSHAVLSLKLLKLVVTDTDFWYAKCLELRPTEAISSQSRSVYGNEEIVDYNQVVPKERTYCVAIF